MVGYEGAGGRGIVTFILTPPTPPTNESGGTFEGSMVVYEICEDSEEDDDDEHDELPAGMLED
jgi:hypothetical protein